MHASYRLPAARCQKKRSLPAGNISAQNMDVLALSFPAGKLEWLLSR
jgi:hypothetical protein